MQIRITNDIIISGQAMCDVFVVAPSYLDKTWGVGVVVAHFKQLVMSVMTTILRRASDRCRKSFIQSVRENAVDSERGRGDGYVDCRRVEWGACRINFAVVDTSMT